MKICSWCALSRHIDSEGTVLPCCRHVVFKFAFFEVLKAALRYDKAYGFSSLQAVHKDRCVFNGKEMFLCPYGISLQAYTFVVIGRSNEGGLSARIIDKGSVEFFEKIYPAV